MGYNLEAVETMSFFYWTLRKRSFGESGSAQCVSMFGGHAE